MALPPPRTLVEAKRYIWGALEATLHGDIHENGSGFIYEFEDDERAHQLTMKAANEILGQLRRKAQIGRVMGTAQTKRRG